MKLVTFLLFASVCWSFSQINVSPVEGINKNDSQIHALVGGLIVTHEKEFEGNIVIRNGLIDLIGAGIEIPKDARIWDVKGKRLYPGLIESWKEFKMSEDFEVSHWNKNVMPDREVSSFLDFQNIGNDEFRGMGFCVIHAVPDNGIFRGESALLLLRDGDEREQVLSSSTGQIMDFDHGSGGYPSSLMGSLALVRQVMSDAEWYKSIVNKYEKKPSEFKRATYNRALKEVDLGGRFFSIARDELDYDRILSLKNEFDLNVSIYGNGKEYRRIDVLNNLDSSLIIPINFPKVPSVKDPVGAMDYSLEELQHWEFAPSNPAYLDKKGISFSISSSKIDDPSNDFWKQIRTAVNRGLDANIALKSLTLNPAKLLGVDEKLGSLSQGKIANLFVADGDVFKQNDSKIETTWVEGIPYLNDDPSLPDVSGEWEIVFPDSDKSLTWKIPKGKSIKIDAGDGVKFPAQWKNNRLLLFPPSKVFGEANGSARMSASYDEKKSTMNGVAIKASGETFWWNAKKVGELKEAKEEEKSNDSIIDSPKLEFTHYPAGAYGVERKKRKPQKVLFKNGTIWTSGPSGILKNASVLIEDGKIKKINNAIEVGKEVEIIDIKGKHLTPGLIDCHSHSAISRGVNEGTHSVTVEVRIGDSVDPTDISLYRQLGGGLTTANLLHGSANPMGGQNQVIKLRWGSGPDGLKFKGAKPGVKFALGENVKQSNWGDKNTTRYPQTRMGVEQIMKDSFIAAKEYGDEKIKSEKENIPHRKNYRMEALLEILRGNRIVHIHSYRQDEILMFVRLAQEFGFTVGTFQHVLEGYKVADAIADIGAGGSTFSDWWAYKFEVYDAIPFNGSLMQKMGVITSFNSDSSELACRMNIEAAKAVKYGGLSEEEALKFVTVNPAKQLRIEDRVGSIEPGKDADLVIWNGSPLSTYSKAEQTWIDGVKYFDIKLDEALREKVKKERNRLINIVLNNQLDKPSGNKPDKDADDEISTRRRFPLWVPVSLNNCTTISRGLYHNGQSLHTCTTNGCCK